jgi:hypothetical protein
MFLFAAFRTAGSCRAAGPFLRGTAGLIGGGVDIRTAGVNTGGISTAVSVVGGLAGAARRIAAVGASASCRVAGIGGGHRAAGTCQQRNGDRARCEMRIHPTHSASPTPVCNCPLGIPDFVPVSHLIRRGSGASRDRFVGAVSDEVRCVASLWQTDEV